MKGTFDKTYEGSVSTIRSSLLRRAKTGDQEAWDLMVETFSPMIIKTCRRRGVAPADREDVSQEVLMAAFRGIHRFRREKPGDTFRGWLWTIANYRIKSYWKARNKKGHVNLDADWQQALESPGFEILEEDEESRVENEDTILKAILDYGQKSINETHWKIFLQSFVEEQDRGDIADRFGMRRANVDLIVCRVLTRLKDVFGEVYEFPE